MHLSPFDLNDLRSFSGPEVPHADYLSTNLPLPSGVADRFVHYHPHDSDRPVTPTPTPIPQFVSNRSLPNKVTYPEANLPLNIPQFAHYKVSDLVNGVMFTSEPESENNKPSNLPPVKKIKYQYHEFFRDPNPQSPQEVTTHPYPQYHEFLKPLTKQPPFSFNC